MCGFRLIGEEAIRLFLTNQKEAWDREQAEILEAQKAKARKAREVALQEAQIIVKRPPPKVVKALEPTDAQKRRGATTPTACAYCNTHLFRRKKEVEAGNSFCSSAHQRAWRKAKRAA